MLFKKEFSFFLCSLFLICSSSYAQKNSTGINNTLPSNKSALDVQSSSGAGNQQGILVPRLIGSDTTILKSGITTSEKGLFFYDTVNNHYWFWNGSKWVALGKESSGNGSTSWHLTGNTLLASDTGTTGFKYLGTNSPFPLIFATNGQQRIRISRVGNVAIGTNMMPVAGVPLSLKSNGVGSVFHIQQSASANPLFEFRQNPNNNARLLLYNGSGDIGIELNVEPKESSYFNAGNVGIGNTAPQELLHITNGTLLLEGDAASPTASPTSGSIKFQGADGLNHALVNETKTRDLVLWTYDGPSWRENVRFAHNGELFAGYSANSAYGFIVDKYGDLSRINSLAYNWPTLQDKGVLTNNGAGVLTWSDVSGGLTGTGSVNTVPYWLSTGALGFTNLQYNASGHFGLGVEPNASYLFQAEGASSSPLFYLANTGSGATLWAFNGNTTGTALRVQASGGNAGIFTGGNVGIGTTGPVLPLHIATTSAAPAPTVGATAVGSLRLSTSDSPLVLDVGLADDLYLGAWLQARYASNAATKSPILLNPTGGNVSIGTTASNNSLSVNGGVAVGTNYVGYAAPTNGMIMEGRLGLGTFSPSFNLDIHGNTTDADIHLFNNTSGTSGADGLRINFSGTLVNILNYEAANFNLGTAGANVITMTAVGNVGIGTATPTVKLQVAGSICYTGTSAACSDLRYKERISNIPRVLQALKQVNGVYYYWRREQFKEKEFLPNKQIGVIAQEIEKVFPELVITDPNGYKSVDYPKLSPILLQAIKEQQVLIDSLRQHDLHQDLQLQQLKSALDIKQKQLDEQKSLLLKHEVELEQVRQYLGTQVKDSGTKK